MESSFTSGTPGHNDNSITPNTKPDKSVQAYTITDMELIVRVEQEIKDLPGAGVVDATIAVEKDKTLDGIYVLVDGTMDTKRVFRDVETVLKVRKVPHDYRQIKVTEIAAMIGTNK